MAAGAASGALALLIAGAALLALRGRLGVRRAAAVAVAVPALPLALLAGLAFNRARGLRPADLLRPWGLGPNLLLALALLALAAGAAVALAAWSARWPRRPPRGRRAGLAALALLALVAAAPALARRGGERPRRPPILVLLVDALRGDALSAYGYHRPTTPALDRLAADAVLFRQAIAASTFTKSSVASLFTGRYPYQHGVYWGSARGGDGEVIADVLAARETTLAEALRNRGYLTLGLVQNSHLGPWAGFAQGFVDYRDQQGGIERINRRFLDWLPAAAGRPWLAYLHYIDLHDPYRPRPPWDRMFGETAGAYEGIDLSEWGAWLAAVRRGEVAVGEERLRRLRALYDGQLRWIDGRIGELLDRLREQGLYDETLIVVTSDHGEAFLEHGFVSHSATPYEELVRVPLLIKLPSQRGAGTVIERQVRLVDLLPTLVEAAGGTPPAGLAGCSLLPLLRDRRQPVPPECATAVIEIAEREEAPPTVAVRVDGAKYIRGPAGEELYDLAADPRELHDLAPASPPELATLRAVAAGVAAAREVAGADRVVLDERTVQELKALGYID